MAQSIRSFFYLFIVFLSLLVVGMGCGSNSGSTTATTTDTEDTTDDGVALSTIDELPAATSPVESSASASALQAVGLQALASAGLPLGATTASAFDSTSSIAACEMLNMTKQSINEAAQADRVLCYIQETFAAATAAGLVDAAGEPIDIYDGNDHIVALDFSGSSLCGDSGKEPCDGSDDNGPDKVKIKIVKDKVTGKITQFEMFACSNNSQDEYVSQTVSGSTLNMVGVNTHQNSEGDFIGRFNVDGSLNDNGNFSDSKTINMQGTRTGGTNNFWGVFAFTQMPTTALFNGTMGGNNLNEQNELMYYHNRITGSLQLIEGNTDFDNYNIGLLAMGDGAVKGCAQGGATEPVIDADCIEDETNTNSQTSWKDNFLQAWAADVALVPPLEDPTVSDFYAAVNSASLPNDPEPTVGFATSEAWDCGGTVDATISFATLGVTFDSCSNLELNHSHINCWEIAGNNGGN